MSVREYNAVAQAALSKMKTTTTYNYETPCRICGEWHDEHICPERNPTTGEQDIEARITAYLSTGEQIADAFYKPVSGLVSNQVRKKELSDMINAALAAEQEESAKWRSEAAKTNELRQQLAAVQELIDAYEEG